MFQIHLCTFYALQATTSATSTHTPAVQKLPKLLILDQIYTLHRLPIKLKVNEQGETEWLL